MITACHSCRTSKEIAAYVAAVEAARTAHDLAALSVAEVKRKVILARCVTCKRCTEHDDIRIQHSQHNRDELTAATIHSHELTWATAIPEEDEKTLLQILGTLFSLDTLQFLAALHMSRRGTARTFPAVVRDFVQAVRSYRNGRPSKATIKAKFSVISTRMPCAAALQSWKDGHGGRQKVEVDGE